MALREVKAGDPKLGVTRLQIMGPPASFKTTVAATFDRPITILGLPGEKHTDVITPTHDLRVLIFDPPNYGDAKNNWLALWTTVRLETQQVIDGKYGAVNTLVLDGAHKAFYVCYMAAKQKFATDSGDWNGLKGWTWIRDEFLAWFSQAFYSGIPWVVWIVWSAREQDESDPNIASKRKQIWPDYMGQFQQTCMGETNIIYQYVEGGKAYWQIRPDEKVRGVGLRVPVEQAVKLPIRIPAEWAKLKAILQPTMPIQGGANGHVSSTATGSGPADAAVLGQAAGVTVQP